MTQHSLRITPRLALPIALLLSLAACGGGGADEGTEETAGGDTAGGETTGEETAATGEDAELRAMIQAMVVPPETPWSEMSHEDRGTDMVMRFEPVFRVMFQAHDAEEFDHFNCATCHGDNADEVDYAMPSPQLPAVPHAGTPEYQAMTDAEPHEVRFMEEDVTPAMQTMLGMGTTFTCHGCHPVAE